MGGDWTGERNSASICFSPNFRVIFLSPSPVGPQTMTADSLLCPSQLDNQPTIRAKIASEQLKVNQRSKSTLIKDSPSLSTIKVFLVGLWGEGWGMFKGGGGGVRREKGGGGGWEGRYV